MGSSNGVDSRLLQHLDGAADDPDSPDTDVTGFVISSSFSSTRVTYVLFSVFISPSTISICKVVSLRIRIEKALSTKFLF